MRQVRTGANAYIIDENTGVGIVNDIFGHFPCSWNMINIDWLQYPWCMYMRKSFEHKAQVNSA